LTRADFGGLWSGEEKLCMRLAIGMIVAALFGLMAPVAGAMQVQFGTSGGLKVVVVSGQIRSGDARRLARALAEADRDRHGTKLLYLESEGGLVTEALRMAEVIQSEGVTTIVRRDALCASACASVLFVAGKYRTVEKGGLLAIHSCYDSLTGRAASECNAAISAQADRSGVLGSTMMALQEAAGSDAMIIFEADDASCFGLTLKPGTRPSRKTPPCLRQITGR
jgi:hypothetical protein